MKEANSLRLKTHAPAYRNKFNIKLKKSKKQFCKFNSINQHAKSFHLKED